MLWSGTVVTSRIDIIGQNGNDGLHYIEGMRVVYKYDVSETLIIPHDSLILKVAMQKGKVMCWVDLPVVYSKVSTVNINVYATGERFIPKGEFLETFFDGDYVWHAYIEGVEADEVDFIPE